MPLAYKLTRDVYPQGEIYCDLCDHGIGIGDNDYLWHCAAHGWDLCKDCV